MEKPKRGRPPGAKTSAWSERGRRKLRRIIDDALTNRGVVMFEDGVPVMGPSGKPMRESLTAAFIKECRIFLAEEAELEKSGGAMTLEARARARAALDELPDVDEPGPLAPPRRDPAAARALEEVQTKSNESGSPETGESRPRGLTGAERRAAKSELEKLRAFVAGAEGGTNAR